MKLEKYLLLLGLTKPYFTSPIGEAEDERVLLEFLSQLPTPVVPLEVRRVLLRVQESK